MIEDKKNLYVAVAVRMMATNPNSLADLGMPDEHRQIISAWLAKRIPVWEALAVEVAERESGK
jgi:hypothetical protein